MTKQMAERGRRSSRRAFALGVSACLVATDVARADEFDTLSGGERVAASDWLKRRPDVPRIGAPAGDLVIVEFIDYRCAYCRLLQPTLARLLEDFPTLSVGLAEWPIYGTVSTYAARLALIAARHGLFRPVHDALFVAHDTSLDVVLATALAAGLHPDVVSDQTSIAWADRQLAAIAKDATAMALTGTPTLLIGRKVIRGALSYADLHELLVRQAEPVHRG